MFLYVYIQALKNRRKKLGKHVTRSIQSGNHLVLRYTILQKLTIICPWPFTCGSPAPTVNQFYRITLDDFCMVSKFVLINGC